MQVSKSNIGKVAEITNTKFESHKAFIGKRGIIVKAIVSRNIYQLELHDESTFESFPENVKIFEHKGGTK